MALTSVTRPLLIAAWLTGVSSGPQHRAHTSRALLTQLQAQGDMRETLVLQLLCLGPRG